VRGFRGLQDADGVRPRGGYRTHSQQLTQRFGLLACQPVITMTTLLEYGSNNSALAQECADDGVD